MAESHFENFIQLVNNIFWRKNFARAFTTKGRTNSKIEQTDDGCKDDGENGQGELKW